MSEIALPRPIEWPRWIAPVAGLGAVLSILMILASGGVSEGGGEAAGEQAACTVTVAAANATQAAVETARDDASTPDCVTVPSGSATWTGFDYPARDFQLIGASTISCSGTPGTSSYACDKGATNTTITTASTAVGMNMGYTQRFTGFEVITGGSDAIFCDGAQAADTWLRIDHNVIRSTDGWVPIRCFGSNNAQHPQAIFDHNRLEDGVAIHPDGTNEVDWQTDETMNDLWAQDIPLGGRDDRIFVEANYFINDTGAAATNYGDGNYGARGVARFNNYDGDAVVGHEFHSIQGPNRGFQRWEYYKNNHNDLDVSDECFFGMAFIRGGTGVMFDNDMTGDYDGCNFKINMDNQRSEATWGPIVVARCDGTSPPTGVDQETTSQEGWRCRDQIGSSHDTTSWSWNGGSPTAYAQVASPAYFWMNTTGGTTLAVAEPSEDSRNDIHIVANRDFYDGVSASAQSSVSSPFNGTVGVGHGTIANRPTTCTTGVAYWATDEGEWDSTNGATADGNLYKCTSTNTWTLYYTPYTYPHPWTVDE